MRASMARKPISEHLPCQTWRFVFLRTLARNADGGSLSRHIPWMHGTYANHCFVLPRGPTDYFSVRKSRGERRSHSPLPTIPSFLELSIRHALGTRL